MCHKKALALNALKMLLKSHSMLTKQVALKISVKNMHASLFQNLSQFALLLTANIGNLPSQKSSNMTQSKRPINMVSLGLRLKMERMALSNSMKSITCILVGSVALPKVIAKKLLLALPLVGSTLKSLVLLLLYLALLLLLVPLNFSDEPPND